MTSISFLEGGPVEVGQLLASIESPALRAQLDLAVNQLADDRKTQTPPAIRANEAAVAEARRQLAYGQVRAPHRPGACRQVDPGNFVRAGDPLLVITQLQPIAVVFAIPEDALPPVRALLRGGAPPVVEVWNRDMSGRLATGRLTAVDNEIDVEKGTIKLKPLSTTRMVRCSQTSL